jgi:hypothetical protein
MSNAAANRLLKKLGFFKVSENFDQYNIKDLQKIKKKLPKRWVEQFNLWLNYGG